MVDIMDSKIQAPKVEQKPEASPPVPPPPESNPNKTQRSRLIKIVSIGALIVLFAGLAGFGGDWLAGRLESNTNIAQVDSSNDGNLIVTDEEEIVAKVVEKVKPSVVSIVTTNRVRSIYGTLDQQGAGTGIIISKDGYVITNNHVVDGARTVSVLASDGTTYDNVSVIGSDPLNDIAFLKIPNVSNLTPAELGDSSSVRLGQKVIAIGNALGQYQNTVTSGIVSGLGRPVTASTGYGSESESLTDLIQTDAAINSGNSGGPLVNSSGQVIGINTAVATDANNIGFAIPVNSTKGVMAGVLKDGKISRAFLGVQYLSIDGEVANEYDLNVRQGAYIYSNEGSAVSAGSPAAKAGLKSGDVITKVDSYTVGEQGSVSSLIGQYKPGDTVTLTYIRDGKTRTTKVTLGEYSE